MMEQRREEEAAEDYLDGARSLLFFFRQWAVENRMATAVRRRS
jgi:hypothetical protein